MDSESEDSDQPEVDSNSDNSEVMDSDSDNSDVDPAHAARAALLVARFAAAIRATKELQALRNRPQLLALEKLVLKRLYSGDSAFLKQKRLFRMMPGRLLEKILREGSRNWRRPPLVGVMANPHTRHLYLELEDPPIRDGEVEGWTLEELDLLCSTIAREGKNALLRLEIKTHEPKGKYPGLDLVQLSSLLLELRALTSLHLECNFEAREIDLLVSILASTNPDIRSLQLPNLSNKSLCTIAERWPQLEFLKPEDHKFDSPQLEAVLPRLRNLETLGVFNTILSKIMLKVARAHDPASPPYKLAQEFIFPSHKPVNSADMVKVFTAFPALHWLTLEETDIPAVCAGLEGREHVHITDLEVQPTSSNPRALEPLLDLQGKHLTKLQLNNDDRENCVDLNMIGHYCPKLEVLDVFAGLLISGDEFAVTDTCYSKLRVCCVIHNTQVNGPAQLPADLVCHMLGSPTLERLDCRGVPITEEVVAALTAERGALSSLQELEVWHHPSLDVGVLAELVSHAPRLRSIILKTDEEDNEGFVEMRGVLESFVQQSELNIEVSDDIW